MAGAGRPSNAGAHGRLALPGQAGFGRLAGGRLFGRLPHAGGQLEDGRKQPGVPLALLHDGVPPRLVAVMAGGRGDFLENAGRRHGRRVIQGQCVALRQVHEPGGDAALQGEPQRLILRREAGERVIDGPLQLVGAIDQQGHGHDQRRVGQPVDEVVGVGRPLDQHAIRLEPGEGGQQGA